MSKPIFEGSGVAIVTPFMQGGVNYKKLEQIVDFHLQKGSDAIIVCVLQDIHWSGGSVGYFPTYSLGTFLGAQWEEKIKTMGIKENDFGSIKKYLRENIHQYGATYTLKELLLKNNMKFDPMINIKYLKDKYLKIYH